MNDLSCLHLNRFHIKSVKVFLMEILTESKFDLGQIGQIFWSFKVVYCRYSKIEIFGELPVYQLPMPKTVLAYRTS